MQNQFRIVKKPFDSGGAGGNYYIYDGNQEIGHATAMFVDKDDPEWNIKAKTMVLDTIELYHGKYRRQGLGSSLLKYIEDEARKSGMERALIINVMVTSRGFWKKQGYTAYAPISRFRSKDLKGNPSVSPGGWQVSTGGWHVEGHKWVKD
jgi:GNAT superfamily N-acetyltransferase